MQPLHLPNNQDDYADTVGGEIKLFKRVSVRQTDSNDNSTESGDSSIESNIEELIEQVESCFPGNAAVKVENIGWVPMRNLRTGDRVLQANGAYSEVFGFSHRLRTSIHPFRRICTVTKCMTASHGHYIYTKQKLVAAGAIKAGDFLATGVDEYEAVIGSEDVWEQGLYNPHTLTGEFVVEGFRVSCYTTAVRPDLAKTLLSPLRAAFRVIGADISGGLLASVRQPWMFPPGMLGQSSLAL
ncbi:Protein hedgehog [Gracilariopsis chorda]|uniref:Protein hedgehog n=1 Tax=Gracilariopsis chorda TaxID=448386 RepID=A0A2V3IFE3_9FLOR|nr:Protein hedgehog [Gracilariopsis chorda]|eukprot:PXF40772.1 Protein hedgehog [Gracilariopsis chorda]